MKMANSNIPAKGVKRSTRASRKPAPRDNREQYERQAEALITLLDFEYGAHDEGADIRERRKRPLCKGIRKHMRQLLDHADFLDPRTIRMFYVKLRLWGDVLEAEGAERYGTLVATEPQMSERAAINLDGELMARLERLAERSARYRDAGDVAAEIVRLYVGMLEEVEDHMAEFRRGQFERELGKRS
jgi:predicted transcriptional regulator